MFSDEKAEAAINRRKSKLRAEDIDGLKELARELERHYGYSPKKARAMVEELRRSLPGDPTDPIDW